VKMRPEFSAGRNVDGYVMKQLRERHRDLAALESERQLISMSPSDYLNCRRSLLQAIDELETLLRRTEGKDYRRHDESNNTKQPPGIG
jgi:hypothetical protein